MKRIIFLLAAVAMTLSMYAQTGNAAAIQEVKASVAKIESAKTPCNSGKEPFKDFIQKFNTDSAFMASRIKLPAKQAEEFKGLLHPGSFQAMEPYERDNEGTPDWFYQVWGPEIQFGKVYLTCSWVDSFYTHIFEWTRGAGGLWYLTAIDS